MIIDTKKFLILGAKEDISQFFDRAQQNGVIEFISPLTKRPLEVPIEIQHLHDAMRILKKLPVMPVFKGTVTLEETDAVSLRIMSIKEEIERLLEERRLLKLEIARISPLGDFSLEDIEYIDNHGKVEIQFFCMKTTKSHAAEFGDEMIYIGTEYDLDYFMTINKRARSYPGMIEMRIDRSLGELKENLVVVEESLHQYEQELKSYAGHLEHLHEAYVERLNTFHLELAKKEVTFPLENASLFCVEAWVPVNKINTLYAIIDGMAIHAEQILIEEADRIPTYMENRGIPRMGQDLVLIYDVPAPTDKDPSGWVFWFFALFFAIIVADGGYGLLYLALCLFIKYKFPPVTSTARRFLKLGIILSTSCIIWGILTASFFGIQAKPGSLIGDMSATRYLAIKKADYHLHANDDVKEKWVKEFPNIAHAKTGQEFLDGATKMKNGHIDYAMQNEFTDNILLEFSLLIGMIHISIGLLRYLLRHWAGIGWICFMVGSYLYFPSMLNATSLVHILGIASKTTGAEVGLQLIYVGIGSALVLALIQKRLKGAGEIANLVQVFADVLSYLRLYALGLAGAIMAATFNEIGQNVGLFLGVLVILVGHSVNILLGIMAGTIHGLRLNFIEWYHYCFDGGGRLFRPLMRLKPKEHI